MNKEPLVNEAKKKKNKNKKKGSQKDSSPEAVQTEKIIQPTQNQQPQSAPQTNQKKKVTPTLNLQQATRDETESDELASRSSRSSSTEAPEFKALNRQEELIRQEFTQKLQGLQEKFHHRVKTHAEEYANELQKDFTRGLYHLSAQDFSEHEHGMRPPKNANEKKFQYRDSMLNIMFEQNENIRTLYNMAIAAISILFCNFLIYEYNRNGFPLELETLRSSFNKLDVVFNIWIRIFFVHLLIIPFTRWVHHSRPSGWIWIPLYIAAHFYDYYYAYMSVKEHDLGFASACIVLCEATRMGMKAHSYLRNKLMYGSDIWIKYRYFIPRSAKRAGVTESDLYIPDIKFFPLTKEVKKYLYFLFVPTLVYRDKYPRAPRVNYGKVLFHYTNFVLCVYLGYMLYKILVLPQFENTGKDTGTLLDFVLSILSTIMPGITCMLMLFFGMLHSWFNAFAELMRFPDRHFYEDWWNVLEFGAYYRKWNIVVHEWLYYYVYCDVSRFTNERTSRTFCQLLTFFISAVVHEVIIAGAMGFFYPILFVIFTGPGIIFIRGAKNVKSSSMNIVFWFLLFLGTGIIFTLYSREYFARKDGDVDPEKWGAWYTYGPRAVLLALDNNSKA